MQIDRSDDAAGKPADPAYFTGEVRMRALVAAEGPARAEALRVTFPPGARTHWHTHPAGQTLVIVAGRAWVQREGAPRETVGVGDVVRFAPGERHWHGATDAGAMTHIAVQERVDGRTADWAEAVDEGDYRG
ncbi:cupin domain-containing protein [Jannaschia sp. W003]|uniref:(R)-mandelonitrile lyase n=1 Tax=Jannaschia sp. W003 TaxID=2867012 RepID=UPI0021A9108A|nr:cupin domain-containing protein [Jannaschia sp. W003]UWQ21397.1 cupin domain-containing protein [Jannaschia sp. W003]